MAVTRVQANKLAGFANSVSASFTTLPTNGNLLIMFLAYSASTISITGGWTLLDSVGSSTHQFATYYKIAASEPASYTLTNTATTSAAYFTLDLIEVSGQAASNYINQHTLQQITGATVSAKAATPSVLNCYPIACFSNANTVTYTGLTANWIDFEASTSTAYLANVAADGPLTTDISTPIQPSLTWSASVTSNIALLLITPDVITVTSTSLTFASPTDTAQTVTISGGVTPYSINTAPNSGIATASLSTATLTVTPVGAGSTSVIVQDSKGATATISIVVDAASSSGSGTTPVVAQSAAGSIHAGTVNCTLAAAPTSGNLLVVAINIYPVGTAFTPPNGLTALDTSATKITQTYYRVVQPGDGSTWSTACPTGYVSMCVWEVTGQNASAPIDQHSVASDGSGTVATTPSLTPSQSNDLPLAVFVNGTTATYSALTTGYTTDASTSATVLPAVFAHGPATSTTATSASLTWSTSVTWDAALILIAPSTAISGNLSLIPNSLAVPYNAGMTQVVAVRDGYTGNISATSSNTADVQVVGGGAGSPQSFQVLRQTSTGSQDTLTFKCADGVSSVLQYTCYGPLQINSTSSSFQPTGFIQVSEKYYRGTISCTITGQVAGVPVTPVLGQAAQGSLAATTYYVKTTFVNSVGETLASTEASLAVSASNVLQVTAPDPIVNATGWNVYVSTATGTETKQNASPLTFGTIWTEPTTGLIAGSALPTNNTTALCTVSPASQTATGATPISFTFTPTNISYGTMMVSFTDSNGVTAEATVLITGPLTVTPSSLTLNAGGASSTITATESADPATIIASSSNPAIATVSTTTNGPGNSTITVTPVAAGSCTVTVNDQHGGTSSVSVTVTPGLSLSASSLTFVDPKSAAQTVTISNGTSPYTALSSVPGVATATVSSSTLTVTPVGGGSCTVTVQDSASPANTVTIPVTVGASMTLSQSSINVPSGHSDTTTQILNGRAPYTSGSSNTGVATTSVSGSTVTVNGIASGTATITVTDADSETATLSVSVASSLTATPSSLTFANKSAASQTSTIGNATTPITALTSNATIATATVSTNIVTVSPQGPGTCNILVTDATNLTITISVTVNATSSTAYTINFTSPFATAQSVTLSGGSNYTFTIDNPAICSMVLSGSSGIIKPKSPGTAHITIYDSAGDQSVITVNVASVQSTIPTWTDLQTKQLVKFFDPASSSTFTPQINPTQQVNKPGNSRKYTMTTNTTSVIQGSREYPPKEISLTWNCMDASDFESLRVMQSINPIVYVDNNDVGYLGVLVFDSVEQLPNVSKKVYRVMASFLVLNPYNGQVTILNQLIPPTLSLAGSVQTTGGYIAGSTTLYFWTTVTTPSGESLPSSTFSVATPAGTNTNYFTLQFTAPTSAWYRKTRIYWNSTNSSVTSTLLAECLAGQPSTFKIYTAYLAYSTLGPPTYGTAFTGRWDGGKWTQTT